MVESSNGRRRKCSQAAFLWQKIFWPRRLWMFICPFVRLFNFSHFSVKSTYLPIRLTIKMVQKDKFFVLFFSSIEQQKLIRWVHCVISRTFAPIDFEPTFNYNLKIPSLLTRIFKWKPAVAFCLIQTWLAYKTIMPVRQLSWWQLWEETLKPKVMSSNPYVG